MTDFRETLLPVSLEDGQSEVKRRREGRDVYRFYVFCLIVVCYWWFHFDYLVVYGVYRMWDVKW